MDCKKLLTYGAVFLVGMYLLKDICGFKMPSFSVEGMADIETVNTATPQGGTLPSDPNSYKDASINSQVPSCNKKPPLEAKDLLPAKQGNDEVQKFSEQHPDGEGILKGVNYLESTFHAGVNTIGQSLRNANLNLRAEPPNPRVQVSPWMNSTIDRDLSRKPLSDNLN